MDQEMKNYGQINQNLKFFLDSMDVMSCGLKRTGTIQLVVNTQYKSLHLKVWCCITACGVYSLLLERHSQLESI